MHELGVTKELVSVVLDKAKFPVTEVYVELGALSSYKEGPLIYYFDLLKEGLIKEAKLKVKLVKGKIKCSCGTYEVDEPYMIVCPKCGSSDVKIIEGRDLKCVKIVDVRK